MAEEFDDHEGETKLYTAVTATRRLFGFERRQLLIFGFPVLLLVFGSRDWHWNLFGLGLGALLLPILRYTGDKHPFLLDDLFGYWLFESHYTADCYPDGAPPRIFKEQ